MQRIKQESSLMGGGSLACLLHHFLILTSPEATILNIHTVLVNARLVLSPYTRWRSDIHYVRTSGGCNCNVYENLK
jgi:hypothetical protein